MARMGSYCKAYYVGDLAAFRDWNPRLENLRPEVRDEEGGSGAEVARESLSEEDVLFLQEDFGVTDGVFIDEHVVFADAGPEWRAFCTDVLGFAVPDYAAAAAQPGGAQPEPEPAGA